MHSYRTITRLAALVLCAAVTPAAGLGARLQDRNRTAGPSTTTEIDALTIDERLRDYDRFTLDTRQASKGVRGEGALTLETKFGTFTIALEPHDLRGPGYVAEVETRRGTRRLDRAAAHTYKGRAFGLRDAEARFTVHEGKVEGMITASDETYFVEPATAFDPLAPAGEVVFYRSSDLVELPAGVCGTSLADDIVVGAEIVEEQAAEKAGGTSGIDYRVLEIATEADTEYVNVLGGATAANNEILSILNAVEGVYQTELGITFDIVYQHAWSTSDPYSGTSASTVLEQFRSYWNTNYSNVARDIAHMWTGRDMDGSTIGIAYMGVVCSSASYSYGVSQRMTSSPQKNILTAHEIGHNFNAGHSDGQSGCSNTIMQSSVGTGFTFCQYSRNQINTWVSGHTSCMPLGPGGGGSTLAAPTGLTTSVSGTTVSLSWNDTNTTESGYRIERKTETTGTYTQIAQVGTNVRTYSDGGRSAGTYFYRVRAYDATTTSGYSNEASATVGNAGGTNLIANGTFESGSASWSQSTASIINSSTATPSYSGAWEATMLGRGLRGNAYVQQSPSFPTVTTGSKTLTFYLRINSAETGSTAYDYLRVRVTNSLGSTLTTLATFSNVHESSYGNYALVTLTIPSQYCIAGNRIRFFASEDSAYATSFSIDNVAIN